MYTKIIATTSILLSMVAAAPVKDLVKTLPIIGNYPKENSNELSILPIGNQNSKSNNVISILPVGKQKSKSEDESKDEISILPIGNQESESDDAVSIQPCKYFFNDACHQCPEELFWNNQCHRRSRRSSRKNGRNLVGLPAECNSGFNFDYDLDLVEYFGAGTEISLLNSCRDLIYFDGEIDIPNRDYEVVEDSESQNVGILPFIL